jgi:hypothetical protein
VSARLYVYRIVVDRWPTDDGKPWARFYGPSAAAPHHEIPDWLAALVDAAMPLRYAYRDLSDLGRVASRIRYDDDREIFQGVLMPKPHRVHYLSASGAHELARDMQAFGAVARVTRSKAVEWEHA